MNFSYSFICERRQYTLVKCHKLYIIYYIKTLLKEYIFWNRMFFFITLRRAIYLLKRHYHIEGIHNIFDLFYLWPLSIIIKFQSKTFFLFLLTIYPHGIILHNIGCSVSPTPCGLLPLPSDDPYLELIDFSLLLLGNPLEQIPNI